MKAETWNAEKCEKLAKRSPLDAYGSTYPQGYVFPPEMGRPWVAGKQSEIPPLPKLAKGFRWETRNAWGWFIVKTGN